MMGADRGERHIPGQDKFMLALTVGERGELPRRGASSSASPATILPGVRTAASLSSGTPSAASSAAEPTAASTSIPGDTVTISTGARPVPRYVAST